MRGPLALRSSPKRSFEALYRRHAAEVYRYSLGLTGSPADAEDVTQATFLNAFRALERGERPRDAAAWLRAISLNLCRQRARNDARRPSEVPLEEGLLAARAVDPETPSVEEVTRAIKHLPFNQRAALVMREFVGLKPGEIARSLEMSDSAVETLLFRARRSLREQLEGSLSCEQAERAISLQLDGALARADRGPLRAHLRECPECARLARGVRAQRSAMRKWAAIPLPGSLAWLSQYTPSAATGAAMAGGAPVAGSLAAKVAAGAAAASIAAGAGGVAINQATADRAPAASAERRAASPAPAEAATRAASSFVAPAARVGAPPRGSDKASRKRRAAERNRARDKGAHGRRVRARGRAGAPGQAGFAPLQPSASAVKPAKPLKPAKPAKPVRQRPAKPATRAKVKPVHVKAQQPKPANPSKPAPTPEPSTSVAPESEPSPNGSRGRAKAP